MHTERELFGAQTEFSWVNKVLDRRNRQGLSTEIARNGLLRKKRLDLRWQRWTK